MNLKDKAWFFSGLAVTTIVSILVMLQDKLYSWWIPFLVGLLLGVIYTMSFEEEIKDNGTNKLETNDKS